MIQDTKDALVSSRFDRDSGEAIAVFNFDADLDLFKGHFPGDPIVPGVHQIEIVRTTLEKSLDAQLRIQRIKSAKFVRKVLPSEDLHIVITGIQDADPVVVKAIIKVGDEVASRFAMEFSKVGDAADGNVHGD